MFLLINKPSGPTSHDIIDQLRAITGIQKIGHSGTLDPFASGLLIIGVGRESTKQLDQFLKLDKIYQATLCLGTTTDTYDRTGLITQTLNVSSPTEKQVRAVLNSFIGPQLQTPPMYSAKKIKGQKLYQLAHQGIAIERHPSPIKIYDIKLKNLKIKNLTLTIEVHCSSGTYIRSLAHDIGQILGCGAYLKELKRIQVGAYSLENAINIDKLTRQTWEKFAKNL